MKTRKNLKRYSSKSHLWLSFFSIVISSIWFLGTFFCLISNINNSIFVCICSFGIAASTSLLAASLFYLNRYACIVWYNKDFDEVCRKGFICGYEYRVKVSDIKEVATAMYQYDSKYYILVDANGVYPTGKKLSYIRLERNRESEAFIRSFYNKPIAPFWKD